MNQIDRIFSQNPKPDTFAGAYLEYLSKVFLKLDKKSISQVIETFLNVRKLGSTIFFIGNGGSATTASHFANDLAIGTKSNEKPFRAVSLCDNISILTAIGNDFGYDQLFVRQLQFLLSKDDVLVAISASGNSPNVVKAVEYANEKGAITIGLTGFDGGRLKSIARMGVHVPCEKGEYGPVEDVHMILDHLVAAFLLNFCKAEASRKA